MTSISDLCEGQVLITVVKNMELTLYFFSLIQINLIAVKNIYCLHMEKLLFGFY